MPVYLHGAAEWTQELIAESQVLYPFTLSHAQLCQVLVLKLGNIPAELQLVELYLQGVLLLFVGDISEHLTVALYVS